MLSLSAGQDPLSVLASTPKRIAALIAGRDAGQLRRSPGPGRWSVAQIIAHLADAEIVGAYRFRMILAAPGTPIQAFDQDALGARAEIREHATRRRRSRCSSACAPRSCPWWRGLNDEELDRFGIHAERGKESVRHLLSLYAGHDLNHLAQIERLTA